MFKHKIRIVGGKWKGRKIAIQHPLIRPTPNRVRETLFNWITPTVQGARCLDLFAGSGALGLEALSRGASHATFIEKDKVILNGIRDALQSLNAMEVGTLVHADAFHWLSQSTSAHPFCIVFVDPSFRKGLVEPLWKVLTERGWLKNGSLIYVETEKNLELTLPAADLIKSGATQQVSYRLYTFRDLCH